MYQKQVVSGLNNSVIATIDNDKVNKLWYNDYGKTNNITQGFEYNEEQLDSSGLMYLRARYCDPSISRFVQIDNNYAGEQEQVNTQNRYSYTINNAYKYVDRDGNRHERSRARNNNPSKGNNRNNYSTRTSNSRTMVSTNKSTVKKRVDPYDITALKRELDRMYITKSKAELKQYVEKQYVKQSINTLRLLSYVSSLKDKPVPVVDSGKDKNKDEKNKDECRCEGPGGVRFGGEVNCPKRRIYSPDEIFDVSVKIIAVAAIGTALILYAGPAVWFWFK